MSYVTPLNHEYGNVTHHRDSGLTRLRSTSHGPIQGMISLRCLYIYERYTTTDPVVRKLLLLSMMIELLFLVKEYT